MECLCSLLRKVSRLGLWYLKTTLLAELWFLRKPFMVAICYKTKFLLAEYGIKKTKFCERRAINFHGLGCGT